ncbi:MAG: hypothetical protein ACREOU_14805 [Candidatus Eiseniibacteriota bacterium]
MVRAVKEEPLVDETPAGDLARAAAAVVCAPIAFARLFGTDGSALEALHGLSESPAERADVNAVLEFAELALLQTDPLAIPDVEEAPGLPPSLRPERTRLRWLGGVPLFTRDGRITGVVCVFDRKGRSGGKAALERLAGLMRGFDLATIEGARAPIADSGARTAERCHEFLAGGAARELARLLDTIDEHCRESNTAATRARGRGRSRTGILDEARSWKAAGAAAQKARGLVATLIDLIEQERTP